MTNKDIEKINHELLTEAEIFADFYDEVSNLYNELAGVKVTKRSIKNPMIIMTQVAEIIDGFDEALDVYKRGFHSNHTKIKTILQQEREKNIRMQSNFR